MLNLDFLKKKDELEGIWETYDDGTGFINVFGWGLNFEKNGNLIYNCWETINQY